MHDDPHNHGLVPGLLAIDTSTERAGVALATHNGVKVHHWAASRAQTTTVLPVIDRLIQEAGLVPADISGIAVAIGPGTFTGLRVGLSIAKGIVAAHGLPLVGIPTLDVVFAMHPDEEIIAVLPAGRGRVVWQERGKAPVNASMDEFVAAVSGATVIGELTSDQAAILQDSGVSFLSEHRDAAVLLRLGASRIQAHDLDDPVSLEPTYLHGVTVNAGAVQDRLRK